MVDPKFVLCGKLQHRLIRYCFAFALLRYFIGRRNLCYPINRSDTKLILIFKQRLFVNEVVVAKRILFLLNVRDLFLF